MALWFKTTLITLAKVSFFSQHDVSVLFLSTATTCSPVIAQVMAALERGRRGKKNEGQRKAALTHSPLHSGEEALKETKRLRPHNRSVNFSSCPLLEKLLISYKSCVNHCWVQRWSVGLLGLRKTSGFVQWNCFSCRFIEFCKMW